MDDREAVARLRAGDTAGLEVLMRRHYERAVRSAHLITRDPALAEDVVQEAFLRVYTHIRSFDPSRPFAPWLLRIVVNGAIRAASARERFPAARSREERSILDLLPDASPGPEEGAAREEMRRAVWAALGELPPEQRAAVVMRYYLGLSEAEMAAEWDCPPGTVKSRLHKARERLRSLLRPVVLP